MMPSFDLLRARLFLSRAIEPPAATVYHFVNVHGPVETVERIRNGTAPGAVLAEVARPDPEIDDDLRALDNDSVRLLTPEDDDWPWGCVSSLDGSGASPLALWVRGTTSLNDLTSPAVTLTGARACSEYGHQVATEFAHDLAVAGVTIVNGGSLGVDAAAHRGAMAAGGRSVVVLPCGVDRMYPQQHGRLFADIIDQGGLLVSECPTGIPPARTRFHARRRLVAALGSATVIVETGQFSCAIAIARIANTLGRRVYGVPGSIYSVTSQGVHELLRSDIASVASSVEHIRYQEER